MIEMLVLMALIAGAMIGYAKYKDRSFRAPRADTKSVTSGDGSYSQEVVGESNYQPALRAAAGSGYETRCVAAVILDDHNEYDNNAIRIEVDGRTVGYLSREDAREYRREIKRTGQASTIYVNAKIFGGGEKHYGIWLDLP